MNLIGLLDFHSRKLIILFLIIKKIYGKNNDRIKKVINTYLDDKFNHNLGVLLISNKGAGKSLCAREICRILFEKYDIPIVIVDKAIVGIDNFMMKLHGRIAFMFDEFDKNFKSYDGDYCKEDNEIYQEKLLTMLDGTSQDTSEKKLYLATCNKAKNISTYLLNRPGRFHYNFRYNKLTVNEIKEYLFDKLESEDSKKDVENHINFINNYGLNYDCLKAIAYELNSGSTIKEALNYLNIVDEGVQNGRYTICAKLKDSNEIIEVTKYIDMSDGVEDVYNFNRTKRLEIELDNILMDIDPYTFRLNQNHKISLYQRNDEDEWIQEAKPWNCFEFITVKPSYNYMMTYQL